MRLLKENDSFRFSQSHILSTKPAALWLYIGQSDVTESMVTTRSPCCGYNLAWRAELKGEDLWSYSHKIESVSLQKKSIRSLAHQQSVFRRCYSKPTFFRVLPTRWRRKPAGIDTERNYVTVTACIGNATVLFRAHKNTARRKKVLQIS